MALLALHPVTGHAGWLFGDDTGAGRSGLHLVQGYDRNTVVAISGRVAVSPDQTADPVVFELSTESERLVVVLGPRWYLQDDNLDWKPGEALVVRGSKARGRDGRTYLLAQWVKRASGSLFVLRNEGGRPDWSGGARGAQQVGNGRMAPGGSGGYRGR